MRLSTRVARLASVTRTAPSGCADCRTWAPVVLLQEGEESRPERCPTCGRVVPIRLVRIYHLVPFDPSEPLPDVLAVLDDGPLSAAADPSGA